MVQRQSTAQLPLIVESKVTGFPTGCRTDAPAVLKCGKKLMSQERMLCAGQIIPVVCFDVCNTIDKNGVQVQLLYIVQKFFRIQRCHTA